MTDSCDKCPNEPEAKSDTPKTDAAERFCSEHGGSDGVVLSDFARSQERALSKALKSLRAMQEMHDKMMSQTNFRASAFDANCIRMMNEAPIEASRIISELEDLA